MSLRGLLALFLVLVAVVGLLAWIGREKEPPADTAEGAPLVAPFLGDALRAIEVTSASGRWTLRRDGIGWRIVEPTDAEADARRVRDVIAGLQDARAGKVVADAGADLAAFGLEPAACRVRLTIDGEPSPRELRLGRTSPVGVDRYATGADGHVVLTDGALFGVVARDAESLRERRLLPVDAETVTRIAIERPFGRLVLAADRGVWRLLEPIQDAASTSACRSLARSIAAIELAETRVVTDPIASRPDRRIVVEIADGREGPPRVAHVAAAGVGGRRLAWRERGVLIGLVPEGAARELEAGVDTFRDKRVTVLSTPDVRWVTIDRRGGSFRVERAEEGGAWSGLAAGAPFAPDGGRVEAFLARLRTLSAVGFETAQRRPPATGSVAAGGGAGALARFSWGPLPPAPGEDGEFLWLTTSSRPGVVFRVLATDLGPLPATAADWAAAPAEESSGGGS